MSPRSRLPLAERRLLVRWEMCRVFESHGFTEVKRRGSGECSRADGRGPPCGGSGRICFSPSRYAAPGASSPTTCDAAASARSKVARGSRMRSASSRYIAS